MIIECRTGSKFDPVTSGIKGEKDKVQEKNVRVQDQSLPNDNMKRSKSRSKSRTNASSSSEQLEPRTAQLALVLDLFLDFDHHGR